MIIHTNVSIPSAITNKTLEDKVENAVEEIIEKPAAARPRKKKATVIVEPEVKIEKEEKVEETEDEVLSRWLKEEEEVNLTK